MTLPNFFIIGAAKSGTTSLYYYLKEHPQIYMSPMKEPEFFSFLGQKVDRKDGRQAPGIYALSDWKEYEALFSGVKDEKIIGEASPSYIYVPEVPLRIRQYISDPKFIAILRDPAERAYSHFNMRLNKLSHKVGEPITNFAEVLKAEDQRIKDGWACGWHYKKRGFYYEQLKRYYELFGRNRIRVFLYEDLRSDPPKVLQEIFRFLGVDESFVPDFEKVHNKGRYQTTVKSKLWNDILRKESPIKTALKPFMSKEKRRRLKKYFIEKNTVTGSNELAGLDPEIRRQLVEEYRPDILKLQDLIGRDLSAWLKTA